MKCIWCANPEGQRFQTSLQFLDKKCTGCCRCVQVCPTGAAKAVPTGMYWDKEECTECFVCIPACLYNAREICGKEYTVDEVLKIVERDSAYYRRSGGGVTLSGGEPLAQPAFAAEVLRRCKEDYGFHTAIETCGYYPWENLEKSIQYLNTIYIDVKLIDPEEHRKYTGKTNERILDNVRLASKAIDPGRQEIIIRTPVIPGINFTEENIRQTTEFILTLSTIKKYELLPYHNYGEAKYYRTRWTDPYKLHELPVTKAEELQPLKDMVRYMGLETN